MPEIVNVVASGDLGRELDVKSIAEDIEAGMVKTQGGEYRTPTMYVRQEESSPLVTVYESGSYHVSGAKSSEDAEEAMEWLVEALADLGIETGKVSFSVANVVVVGDLEIEIDLNRIATELGLEGTEYEPEQFPGLVFRPPKEGYVYLIFSSGRVIITGSTSAKIGFGAFQDLQERLAHFV